MTNEELIKYIRDNIPVNISEELKEKIDELEENIIELEEEIEYFRHGGDVG